MGVKKKERCYSVTATWSNDLSDDYNVMVSSTTFNPNHDTYGEVNSEEIHSEKYYEEEYYDKGISEDPIGYKCRILVKSKSEVHDAEAKLLGVYSEWFEKKSADISESISKMKASIDEIKKSIESRKK